MKRFKLLFSLFTLFLVSSSFATVPQLINFQGRLTDSLGNPVSDGSYSLRFRIYDDSLAGNVLWEETDPIQITKGLFTVLLGSTTSIPDSAFYSVNRWFGIKIGSNPEITPRQRLGSVGYAFQSGQWNSSGNDIYRNSGNVGIGTNSPATKLHVENSAGTAVWGSSPSFTGVYGSGAVGVWASGTTYGGYFAGYPTTGTGYGVRCQTSPPSSSDNAYAGYFSATPSGGSGVTYGVYGEAGTVGVYGTAVNGGMYGTGGNYGVYGASSSGTGVYGSSSSGYGVYADGGPNGVVAVAHNSGGSGVYGSDGGNPFTYAGYFSGDVRVVGDFDAISGTKSAAVKIDNGEYRRLYAQESPENWFEDFGTAQLVNDQATVNIDPLYAQTVNTAVTYHVFLTPEGDCQGLYITGKTPASFEMRELQNGKSNLSVSYRIVAKRKGYENTRLAKLVGPTPEEVQAKDVKLRAEMAKEKAEREQEQLKMEAERKQMEEQRAKMEQELKGTDKK
ncbi:MAG: hypothetical protein RBG1_1C00001G0668 [candidate division Zixibacteria bacterium RBG-1]|nr:MAG: hypothetical protein RBG1_1C00001G0668 [candidate division Zixibacteria bacterium RBG-1]OGC85906.1 MAG: hypothetical protein A2V73_08115 [candidate division Zixibacteria bacterium RBG_19FT_COMBO_42_43]